MFNLPNLHYQKIPSMTLLFCQFPVCVCVNLCRCELNHSVLPIPDTGSEERLQPRSESRLPDPSPAACAEAAPNPRRVLPPPEKPTTIQRAKGQSGTTSLCKNLSWLWRALPHILYVNDCIFKTFYINLDYNNFVVLTTPPLLNVNRLVVR